MSRLFHFVIAFALVLMTAIFFAAYAHAAPLDGGTAVEAVVAPPAPVTASKLSLEDLQYLVATILALAAFTLRRLSPEVHFFRTNTGLVVVSLLSGVLTAVSGAVLTYGLGVKVICVAILAVVGAATAQASTTKAQS